MINIALAASSVTASPTATTNDLAGLIGVIMFYLQQFLLLLVGVAVVMFIYYIIKYFITPDAERKEAGTYLMYSILGFFIIFSFWGLVNILQNTFNLGNSTHPASWSSFFGLFPTTTTNVGNGGGNFNVLNGCIGKCN